MDIATNNILHFHDIKSNQRSSLVHLKYRLGIFLHNIKIHRLLWGDGPSYLKCNLHINRQ